MRVLAIRGKNLASLQGEFEIRLDQPPLSSFGLFSISGPTGAGKSTLLDALCLALYGKTPRLRGDGGHVIGGPAEDPKACLKSNDARGILSRGAADGYAEAEFLGVDGRRHCARWEVRRARGRDTGRLQTQSMTIETMDTGEKMTDRLGAVRAEIERLVGFTYDEFKRTVLLPQFEFTNFLRAKADERATILEHITGGEIFTKLSIAAHERASAEKAKLKEIDDRLAKTTVLSADEHRELARQLADAEARRTAAQCQLKQAERDLQWQQEHAQRASKLSEAQQVLADAEGRLAQTMPLERELAAVVAVQPIRQVHTEAVSAAAERDRRHAAALEVKLAFEQARDAVQNAGLTLKAKEAVLQAARGRDETLRPQIEEARRLDQEGEGMKRQAAESASKLAEVSGSLAEATDELRQMEEKAAAHVDEISAQERWQAEHGGEQVLASEWPRWRSDLARHGDAAARLAHMAEGIQSAGRELQKVRAAHTGAEAHVQEKLVALQAAQAALADLAAGAGTQDLAEARRRSAACRERLAALNVLNELSGRSQQAEASRALHQTALDEGIARHDQLRGRIRALNDELVLCKARLSEARDVLERTSVALDLAEHRAALRDGEPCPLCGALEHPWAKEGAPSVLAPVRQRVTELEQQETSLARDLQAVEREHAAIDNAIKTVQGQIAKDLQAALQAQQDYVAQHGAFAELPERAAEAANPIASQLDDAQAALVEAEAAEAALLSSIERREHAQHAVEEARQQHDEVVAERHRRQAKLTLQEALVRQLDDDNRRLVEERDDIERGLAPALGWLPGWIGEARQAPKAFTAVLERRVTLFKDSQGKLDQAKAALADCRAKLETAAVLITERDQLQRRLAAEHHSLGEARKQLLARRRALLDGRETTLVVQETAAHLEKAERERDTARDESHRAETRAASAASAAATAADALAEQEQRASVAEQELAVVLARLGIDPPTLAKRLACDEAWMESTRATLERLRGGVVTAQATLAERQRQLADLESQGRPAHDLAGCQAAYQEASAMAASSEPEVVFLKARLQQDEGQHAIRRELEAEARVQTDKSQVWGQLDEIIGSADGKRLRVFAQGLAFRALVREANAHLADLAPRYRLRSVPTADLELQVADQDLGGELRSANSLSGGETFLVALALALGLSALSTRATQAQTLFIDEGFGTLDRESLDHAIVALENLQATGRVVGIISHIPELHERFGAQVRVEKVGVGRSRVVVTT